MSNLDLELTELYMDGLTAKMAAKVTGLPTSMVVAVFDRLQREDQEQDRFDDSMDGDFDTAMASAGYGTDEDYGCYDEA
jgi:hypothetical protein|tara:strand:+ start:425 stop:661 length:237 start_codon:yes stop_codon:yes gene_type:complete